MKAGSPFISFFGDNAQGREQPDTLDALAIHDGQACCATAIFGPDRFNLLADDAEICGPVIPEHLEQRTRFRNSLKSWIDDHAKQTIADKKAPIARVIGKPAKAAITPHGLHLPREGIVGFITVVIGIDEGRAELIEAGPAGAALLFRARVHRFLSSICPIACFVFGTARTIPFPLRTARSTIAYAASNTEVRSAVSRGLLQ
jgi:hypothetical protein